MNLAAKGMMSFRTIMVKIWDTRIYELAKNFALIVRLQLKKNDVG